MAKYTTSYADYVRKGGEIPASFGLIEGFEEKFLERYADRELGFETADIFAYKLQLKADLWMADYAERIAKQDELLAKAMAEMTKTSTENRTNESVIGAQRSTTTNLPFNATEAEPNQVNNADASTNSGTDTTTRTETDYMGGGEIYSRLSLLVEKKANLTNELLNKFETLFMGIY